MIPIRYNPPDVHNSDLTSFIPLCIYLNLNNLNSREIFLHSFQVLTRDGDKLRGGKWNAGPANKLSTTNKLTQLDQTNLSIDVGSEWSCWPYWRNSNKRRRKCGFSCCKLLSSFLKIYITFLVLPERFWQLTFFSLFQRSGQCRENYNIKKV